MCCKSNEPWKARSSALAYLKHLKQQTKSVDPVDRRWLNGFTAAGFHSGLISLTEPKLEYIKAYRNAYGKRMSEALEQQLERRLTKLCRVD